MLMLCVTVFTYKAFIFGITRASWSLINRFRSNHGLCRSTLYRWRAVDSDLCSCGDIQTMSHIVESCPETTLHVHVCTYMYCVQVHVCTYMYIHVLYMYVQYMYVLYMHVLYMHVLYMHV